MNLKRHIFNFIADHHSRLNYLPTLPEIRRAFAGLTENVDLHLEQLQREGLLELGRTDDDAVSIPRTFPPARRIELRGAPCPEVASTEGPSPQSAVTLDLRGAGVMLDGDLFAQVVRDDSMADAGIASGDIAILKAASPERGDIVAVEENGRLLLRRYIVMAGLPHFLAENSAHPDLIAAYDKPIHGVLWCLICTQPSGRRRQVPPFKKISYQRDGGLALESQFLAMLKAELKTQPPLKVKQNSQTRSTKSSSVRRSEGKRLDWPKPPSNTALNDKKNTIYHAALPISVTDERPEAVYGATFIEEMARFALEHEAAGAPTAAS